MRSKFGTSGNGAVLLHSNLSYTRFDESDLTAANFGNSIFYGAAFNNCRLARVKFPDADLRDVAIVQSDITGVDFSGANLNGAIWDPTPGTLPDVPSLASALKLQGLRYRQSPRQLVDLREALYKAGLLRQARDVTYAIERTRRVQDQGSRDPLRRLAGWIRFVAFEKTVGYGIYPYRPLLLAILLIPVFAPLYLFVPRSRPRGRLGSTRWPSRLAGLLHGAASIYLLVLTVLCLAGRPFG